MHGVTTCCSPPVRTGCGDRSTTRSFDATNRPCGCAGASLTVALGGCHCACRVHIGFARDGSKAAVGRLTPAARERSRRRCDSTARISSHRRFRRAVQLLPMLRRCRSDSILVRVVRRSTLLRRPRSRLPRTRLFAIGPICGVVRSSVVGRSRRTRTRRRIGFATPRHRRRLLAKPRHIAARRSASASLVRLSRPRRPPRRPRRRRLRRPLSSWSATCTSCVVVLRQRIRSYRLRLPVAPLPRRSLRFRSIGGIDHDRGGDRSAHWHGALGAALDERLRGLNVMRLAIRKIEIP